MYSIVLTFNHDLDISVAPGYLKGPAQRNSSTIFIQGYISWPEFEGGLEKRKGKGGKDEKKSDKTHVKIPL